MKFNDAISILRLLGTRHEDALTIKQIVAKWNAIRAEKLTVRSAQRYLSKLSANGADGAALVNEVESTAREKRYYLRLSEMANWFMTEEAALFQLLSLQVLQSTFGETATAVIDRQVEAAEHLTQEQIRTKRLRERVRIVPDGVGRLRAKISKEVLGRVMDALAGDQKLSIEYLSARGNLSNLELNPLGLVAKDGTLYLLAVKGLSDPLIHYALQRVRSATVRPLSSQGRPQFKLDEYIRQTHQLSHALDQSIPPQFVKLRVHRNSLYHFEERPLSENQEIHTSNPPEMWSIVTAMIPLTFMLRPFLISLGPNVEVLEPESLRNDVAIWAKGMAAHYAE